MSLGYMKINDVVVNKRCMPYLHQQLIVKCANHYLLTVKPLNFVTEIQQS